MLLQSYEPGTAMIVVSGSGKLLTFNPFFLNLTGYGEPDIPALTLGRLLPGFQPPRGEGCHGAMVARMACRNGDFLDVAVNCVSLAGHDPLILTFQDLRVLRQLDDFRNCVIRLAENRRNLERFSAVAGHDLKVPVRKIKLFARQLLEDSGYLLGEEGRDVLERMIRASARMEKLIDSILACADGACADGEEYRLERTEPDRLLREILTALEPQTRERPARPDVKVVPVAGPPSPQFTEHYAAAL